MKTDKQYYSALAQSPVLLKQLMLRIAEAELSGKGRREATEKFAEALGRTMAIADALGRKRVVSAAENPERTAQTFRLHAIDEDYDSLVVARFGAHDALRRPSEHQFEEAFDTLMEREPIVAKNKEEIQKAYGLGRYFTVGSLPAKLGFKAAQNLVVRLWEKVAELGMTGTTPGVAKKALAAVGDFAESYAETIYRTNLAGAFTAGRFRQMSDPDVMAITPAFEYSAVGDLSTRKNHGAADGLVAGMRDAIWNEVSPPMGYNCRCDLRVVDVFELKDRGLLHKNGTVKRWSPANFGNARPDKGFTVSRPDRRMYS